MSAYSYSHGTSAAPLLGRRSEKNLRRTVASFRTAKALVVHSRDIRATIERFLGPGVDRVAQGCSRSVEKGDPRQDLVAEPLGMRSQWRPRVG